MSTWDWFVHGANVLYLISYLVKDVFLLRFVLMVAMIVFLPYYFFSAEEPMWSVIAWNVVFMGVNGYQLYRLFKERRPVQLTAEDDKLYNSSFSSFTMKQFSKLLKFSNKKKVPEKEIILEPGKNIDRVIFITDGEAEVVKNGEVVMSLTTGDLIGEINIITDSIPQYQVHAIKDSKIIYWNKNEFEKACSEDPAINSSWQTLISSRLAEKLVKN